MRRWFFFLGSILIGVAIGLLFGWVIQPVQYFDTPLSSLSAEYKTDYVLMTAETFSFDLDTAAATRRLDSLGPVETLEIVRQAIIFAEEAGYTNQDLAHLRSLQSALMPGLPTSTP
jgi:hypothetical protein